MPDIRAFRGVLYNPQKIEDMDSVVTEPYDVISSHQQNLYYRDSPYNMIRLILGKTCSQDNGKDNSYTRAARFFKDWQKNNILLQDKKEYIYIYAQTFSCNNKKKTRTGFIVLLKLEDFSKNAILPHENTFSHPVQDRLKLLKTVGANLSPIFAMFSDSQKKVDKILNQHKRTHVPSVVVRHNNVLHRIWRLSDKKKIAAIKKLVKNQPTFIADGHHRYESALNYKNYIKKSKKPNILSNYVMTYLVTTTDPGLTILPTHRVVKTKGTLQSAKVLQQLRKFFDIRRFSTSEGLFSYMRKVKAKRILGTYFGRKQFYGLALKDTEAVYKIIGKGKHSLRRDLDVTVIHRLIIEHTLGVRDPHKDICYTRDGQEGIRLVNRGKYQAVLFLRPTTVRQVQKIASSGKRMPHKSTYFYPKLLTGLVINKLK